MRIQISVSKLTGKLRIYIPILCLVLTRANETRETHVHSYVLDSIRGSIESYI